MHNVYDYLRDLKVFIWTKLKVTLKLKKKILRVSRLDINDEQRFSILAILNALSSILCLPPVAITLKKVNL